MGSYEIFHDQVHKATRNVLHTKFEQFADEEEEEERFGGEFIDRIGHERASDTL